MSTCRQSKTSKSDAAGRSKSKRSSEQVVADTPVKKDDEQKKSMRAEEKNLRYRLSAEDYQKIQGYDDLQKQLELDEAKALLAQCQDPQGLVKSLQESAERIRLLEKENVDLSRILTNYVSNPAMLPCRAGDASIKREVLVKREVP
ncbi:unnamed protein product [Cladocopium goreaui]|uniref:Uncharacterized protein n=1 Tax=Cladocopium goreaui TaxID=2562237 RepID=A0A9P1FE78_9DINO|nr:unnamed protein product [Cladocopium goreaui]CAI3986941.1 unnamed protein product [Cladocopium goreaui]CAI4020036.1 unnamed protein product [Cladocopium goreaui]